MSSVGILSAKNFIILFVFSLVCVHSFATTVGNDLAPSGVAFTTFPESDSDNQINGFAWMRNGFAFETGNTSVTFNALFPARGPISINGGFLTLASDLKLENVTNFRSSGTIFGNDQILELSTSVTQYNASSKSDLLSNLNILFHGNMTFSGQVLVRGLSLIDGTDHILTLNNTAQITVDSNSTLTLRNLTLKNVAGTNIKCIDSTANLVFQDCSWIQSGDYTFAQGAITWNGVNDFLGSYTFNYTSGRTSTISARSTLGFSSGITFSVGRKEANGVEPLYLEDSTAHFKLKDSEWVITDSGMRLTNGTIVFDGNVLLNFTKKSISNALVNGSGAPTDDIKWQFEPACLVEMGSGQIVRNIANTGNFTSVSRTSKIFRRAGNIINFQQHTRPQNITIEAETGVSNVVTTGKVLDFKDIIVKNSFGEFELTATRVTDAIYALDGGYISILNGTLPFASQIYNTGNQVRGSGSISGPISFVASSSALTMVLNGSLLGALSLVGGTLTLGNNLVLGLDKTIVGPGIVSLAGYTLTGGTKESTWSAPLYWDAGSSGKVSLRNNVSLSNTWTFSGAGTILGGGNVITISGPGGIAVERGSTLTIQDAIIDGLTTTNLYCMNNASRIVLDNSFLIFDGNFSFTQGALKFKNNVDFVGAYTFAYQSGITSTVLSWATWGIRDGMRLEIGRKEANGADPLWFEDGTSAIMLSNCTFAITASGAFIDQFKAIYDQDVTVEINSTNTNNGLLLGNALAPEPTFQFLPGSTIIFTKGDLVFNMASPDALKSKTKSTRIIRQAASRFTIQQDLTLENLSIQDSILSQLTVSSGKILKYIDCAIVSDTYEYDLTGTHYSFGITRFDGDGRMFITRGTVPSYSRISGTGNTFLGTGNISGAITFITSGAQLTIALIGSILENLALAGGTLILGNDLSFGLDKSISGSGTVSLAGYSFNFGTKESTWSSPLYWDAGSNGKVALRNKLSLSNTWTFSGTGTIEGRGNILDLTNSGTITIERGATLTLKDIFIKGLSSSNIRCLDDASQLILNNVEVEQSTNYTFSVGYIRFRNNVMLEGGKTFAYQTSQTSTIHERATLTIETSSTFSYDPIRFASQQLLVFEGAASVLDLHSATLHVTSTGMQLTGGVLQSREDSSIFVEYGSSFVDGVLSVTDGLTIGASDSAYDCVIKIFSDSKLTVSGGSLSYKNKLTPSLKMLSNRSSLNVAQDASLNLYESVDTGLGSIILESGSLLARKSGTTINGSVIIGDNVNIAFF
jgi:hypothetical protein